MPHVLPVRFTFVQHDLWFDPCDSGATAGDHVICATGRGTEMGLAVADPFEVTQEELEETIGEAEFAPVIRVATEEDHDRAAELAAKGDEALPIFRALAKEEGLPMKPVGVEYLFGGERCVCYFAADDRVDFRHLVRELSRALHERIDMRQIGVREEAALMGGYSGCGQELCCARWERKFEPVSIRMAKEQDLPLNSPKISGVCGRLMCCLRYEFEAYRDFKSRAPKKNALIQTPLGTAKIVDYDTPREGLTLRLENGKTIKVPLEGMECSEAACKKAEANGCSCRPDTVTRAMLDALDSPEVQMALAELDRTEAGEVLDYDSSDVVFVSESRRAHRRAQVAEQKEEKAAREAAREARAKKEARRETARDNRANSKRDTRRKLRDSGDRAAASAPTAPSQPTRRRRRHHDAADSAATASASAPQVASREVTSTAPLVDVRPGRAQRRRRQAEAATTSDERASRSSANRPAAEKGALSHKGGNNSSSRKGNKPAGSNAPTAAKKGGAGGQEAGGGKGGNPKASGPKKETSKQRRRRRRTSRGGEGAGTGAGAGAGE